MVAAAGRRRPKKPVEVRRVELYSSGTSFIVELERDLKELVSAGWEASVSLALSEAGKVTHLQGLLTKVNLGVRNFQW